MLRKFLLLLALVVLVGIALVWTNIIDINWNGQAESPVEVRVNPVEVGTETRQVETPTIRVRDGNEAAPPAAPPANGQ